MKTWSFYVGILLLSACTSDELVVPDKEITTRADRDDVTIRISFAEENTFETRALTGADENRIDSLQVFIFKKGATANRLDDVYSYSIGVPRDSFLTDGPQKKATIKVKSTTDEQRFIMVANAPNLALQLAEGTTLASELMEQLRFAAGSASYWKTSPTFFPMWGETGLYASFPSIVDVDMIRAVAKIEIGVDIYSNTAGDPSLGFASIFKIDSVYLCNVNDSGYIAPKGKIANRKVDIGYKYTATSGRIMERTLYAPETDSLVIVNGDTLHTPAFLVVKASYYDGNPSYYRIDFTAQNQYKPLLRNHHYTMNITGIRTRGYATLAEAKNAAILPINPTLILGDEEALINDIAYMDSYWLGCYSTEVKADWYEQQGGIPVGTSYPGGWKVEIIAGSSWFTLNTSTNNLNYNLANNFTGQPRTATIKLSAGTLSQLIKVTQSPGSNTYVITQGTAARIPLASANIDGINRASTVTSAVSYDLFSNTANIGTSIQGGVVVTPTYPTEGIYQIQAVSNGTVVWVWTVWVVADANIDTPQHYNGYSFMDRNLGALTASGFRSGLYYQWGRKDPASPYITNTFLSPTITPVPPNMDEIEIAKRPNTFFTSATAPYDWMSAGQHNNLWTTIDGEKGPYDPCPFGWRVPVASNNEASPFAGFTNGQNGINFNIVNSRSGYSGADGSEINTAKAIVWGATARGTSAYIYNVTDHTHGSARRVDAYPIRCVRDVKRIGY